MVKFNCEFFNLLLSCVIVLVLGMYYDKRNVLFFITIINDKSKTISS